MPEENTSQSSYDKTRREKGREKREEKKIIYYIYINKIKSFWALLFGVFKVGTPNVNKL